MQQIICYVSIDIKRHLYMIRLCRSGILCAGNLFCRVAQIQIAVRKEIFSVIPLRSAGRRYRQLRNHRVICFKKSAVRRGYPVEHIVWNPVYAGGTLIGLHRAHSIFYHLQRVQQITVSLMKNALTGKKNDDCRKTDNADTDKECE